MEKKTNVDKWAHQTRRKLDKTINHITKHGQRFITSRIGHIRLARRSVIIWLSVVLVLIVSSLLQTIWYNSQVTTLAAASGGTYAEGVVDKLTTINPLYANTDTEKAVSQLVYPGLLSYDSANKLHGELASTWSHDDSGQVWTVKLKPSLTWSDGEALTADDVVYTVELMQNESINSTLSDSWSDIEAIAKDSQTVEFTLPNALMSFDSALTFGILPKHILDGKSAVDISTLNSQTPAAIVGSGAYAIDKIEESGDNNIWTLKVNDRYYDTAPKIAKFIVRTYSDSDSLVQGMKRGEVNAISSVSVSDVDEFDEDTYKTLQLKTSGGVYALFNNTIGLTLNKTVRQALRLALDRTAIRNSINNVSDKLVAPTALETPIATGVYASVDELTQPECNVDEAKRLLDEAGWTIDDGDEYRSNDGTELAINIVTIAGTNYENVAKAIAEQWQTIGVNATVESVSASIAQQNYLVPRNYDVLVYQMHLGADPDVYAYWSSTQASSTGLNLANYQSRRAELALSAGRTNTNDSAREARYVAFVNQWLSDTPAIALYQPSLIYVVDSNVSTFTNGDSVIDASNRFANTAEWTAAVAPVMKTP